MFRIKICGITSVADAMAAAQAGVDAIGLNFYAQSPRRIELAAARTIVRSLPRHVVKVGVFVNESVALVTHVADELVLDFVQLHGDEPPDDLAALAPRRAVRALRLRGDRAPLQSYLQACRQLGHPPAAVLVDAYEPGAFGGTGKTANWDEVRELRVCLGDIPLVLAGGLNPQNVAEAIQRVRPAAVDVASGVESAPGRKDPALMRQLVEAARRAWRASSAT